MSVIEKINEFVEKKKQEKEYIKQREFQDRVEQKIENKKKSPMERELEKYQKINKEKEIEKKVLQIRKDRKYQIEMKDTLANIKPIFKETGTLFKSKNVFTSKDLRPKPSKIIFTGNVRRSK